MHSDPLMPATARLPMNPLVPPTSEELPSQVRPFVLRGQHPLVPGAVSAKHRTPATQRKIEQRTGQDNVFVDDSYFVPDD